MISKQIISEEFKRMQKLAGIITEEDVTPKQRLGSQITLLKKAIDSGTSNVSSLHDTITQILRQHPELDEPKKELGDESEFERLLQKQGLGDRSKFDNLKK